MGADPARRIHAEAIEMQKTSADTPLPPEPPKRHPMRHVLFLLILVTVTAGLLVLALAGPAVS